MAKVKRNEDGAVVSIHTSTLTWEPTGPGKWQAEDGAALWFHDQAIGKTYEVTDQYAETAAEVAAAHASLLEALAALAVGGVDDHER